MASFAQHFRINKNQAELDFVNVDPGKDLPLYIDPYAFSVSDCTWAQQCNDSILSFFESVIGAIRSGNDERGHALFSVLREPNETCFGLSRGLPSGRGLGGKQAADLYERLKGSKAAHTGLLSDLAECELFVEGIGPDKISDITTNIIRKHLIQYTSEQCTLHGIETQRVPSGWLWDEARQRWMNEFVHLPVLNERKILLAPKAYVRWDLEFSHQRYYNDFVLSYLQAEHLNQNSSLVETLKNGRKRVTKKSLAERHPLSKRFLADFTEGHPGVLEEYRRMLGVPQPIRDEELDEEFDYVAFASACKTELDRIPSGRNDASRFHDFMKGTLEFIFYPDLICPEKELEIHEGRKRIDISFTNNSTGYFFSRRFNDRDCTSRRVPFECKNYRHELGNP